VDLQLMGQSGQEVYIHHHTIGELLTGADQLVRESLRIYNLFQVLLQGLDGILET
jgi:hypothetical protein